MKVNPEQLYIAFSRVQYVEKYLCEHVDGDVATLLVYVQYDLAWLGAGYCFMVVREDYDESSFPVTRDGKDYHILNPLFTINSMTPFAAINSSGHWRVKECERKTSIPSSRSRML